MHHCVIAAQDRDRPGEVGGATAGPLEQPRVQPRSLGDNQGACLGGRLHTRRSLSRFQGRVLREAAGPTGRTGIPLPGRVA